MHHSLFRPAFLAATFAVCATVAACEHGDTPHASKVAVSSTPSCTFNDVATLPEELKEASGIVASRAHPGTLWVHNDGGNPPYVIALDTLGHLRGRVRIDVSFPIMDWEDIAIARCGDRDCIYLADIGDNHASRHDIRILRFPEPSRSDSVARPDVFPISYPDEPHDAEALFLLPDERAFIVTKGRNASVSLFAYPGKLNAQPVVLDHMQDFTPGIVQFPDMVTAASATPDGSVVALLSYGFLQRYRVGSDGRLQPVAPEGVPIDSAHESQAEGLALTGADSGFIVGERSLDGVPPHLVRFQCTSP